MPVGAVSAAGAESVGFAPLPSRAMIGLLAAPPTDAEIDRMIGHAVWAPSVLNTQPWHFIVDRGAVHLYADRSRQLRTLDPRGRELTMSCGAALLYLRVAAAHEGWEAEVLPFPIASAPDFLAAATFRRATRPVGDHRLFRALALRRTNRRSFLDAPIPPTAVGGLVAAAASEGASLRVFEAAAEKDVLGHLVAAGVRVQSADPDLVAELRSWLRPEADPRADGVHDPVQGVGDRHAGMRTSPASVAAHKERLIREAPGVAVLWTAGDGRVDWLRAGQALTRVLVVAADQGLVASYANEPVEVAALRPTLSDLVGGGWPQAVFRIGYPEEESETVRRGAPEVTRHRAESTTAEPLRGLHPGRPVGGDEMVGPRGRMPLEP